MGQHAFGDGCDRIGGIRYELFVLALPLAQLLARAQTAHSNAGQRDFALRDSGQQIPGLKIDQTGGTLADRCRHARRVGPFAANDDRYWGGACLGTYNDIRHRDGTVALGTQQQIRSIRGQRLIQGRQIRNVACPNPQAGIAQEAADHFGRIR